MSRLPLCPNARTEPSRSWLPSLPHTLHRLAMAAALLAAPALSQAVSVNSVAAPVSGATWRLAATPDNGSLSGLSLYFSPGLALPAAGVDDALALGALTPRQASPGFSINLGDLGTGAGTPAPLRYTLDPLDAGGQVSILYSAVATPVPEPSTAWLMALGVAGFAFGAHRVASRRLA